MKLDDNNIASIVDKCKRENPKAQKALFIHFAPRVMSLCRRYLNNNETAKDALQECFIQIFESINNYNQKEGIFDAWLYRVAQRTIWKLAKKELKINSKLSSNVTDDQIEIEPVALEKLTNDEVIDEIQNLPKGYRIVLNLFVFEGKSHEEISKLLKISKSSSRSQLARARKLLKKNLEAKNIINYAKNTI